MKTSNSRYISSYIGAYKKPIISVKKPLKSKLGALCDNVYSRLTFPSSQNKVANSILFWNIHQKNNWINQSLLSLSIFWQTYITWWGTLFTAHFSLHNWYSYCRFIIIIKISIFYSNHKIQSNWDIFIEVKKIKRRL